MPATVAVDGAWSLQSLNTAKQGRLFAGTFLQQANPALSTLQTMQTWRTGVLCTGGFLNNASGCYDLATIPTSSPSMAVQVYPGEAVINRAGQGPYIAWSTSMVSNLTIATAPSTNPRYDLVSLQVLDSVLGDGSTAAQLVVTTGTPASSPAVPSTPTGAIPLAKVFVGVNVTSITSANITGLRIATAPLGSARPILEGDSLATGGYVPGELRYRMKSGSIPVDLIDAWGGDGAWHGTRALPMKTTVGTTGVTVTTTTTVATVSIVDPGWSYQAIMSGSVWWNQGIDCFYWPDIRLNSNTGTLIARGPGRNQAGAGTTLAGTNVITPQVSGTLTGANTFYLVLTRDPSSTNGSSGVTTSSTSPDDVISVQVAPV